MTITLARYWCVPLELKFVFCIKHFPYFYKCKRSISAKRKPAYDGKLLWFYDCKELLISFSLYTITTFLYHLNIIKCCHETNNMIEAFYWSYNFIQHSDILFFFSFEWLIAFCNYAENLTFIHIYHLCITNYGNCSFIQMFIMACVQVIFMKIADKRNVIFLRISM